MPIYEFYCSDCHTVFNFLSRTMGAARRPACPRCGRPELERRASTFAISRGRKEPGEAAPEGLDEPRLEKAMASLASEVDSLDDDDPKGAARLMRRLYESAGLPLGPGMAEALRRMESGEDPEAIEEQLGDALEDDPFAAPPEKDVRSLRRRMLPPRVDSTLYEL